ncbi:MAG: prepilin peptidase, partial [Planctomycetota bacterium JB042]
AAAWVDVAEKRIPNVLTYPALGLGILIHVVLTPLFGWLGWDVPRIWLGGLGPADALMGFGLCFLFGIVSFVVRGLGGGDVKLLFAMGAILGLGHVIGALFNGILIAAVLGIVNWALNGSLIARLQVMAVTLFGAVFRGEVPKREEILPFGRSVAPFGLSMFLGLILAQFVELHEVLIFTLGKTE